MRIVFNLLAVLDRWIFSYMRRAGLVLTCSDAPDMTAMNITAAAQAEMSREQLDWAKQLYAETAPDRAAAAERAAAVSDAQLRSMDTNTALAQDYADYQKGTFRPLEQGIVSDAQAFDTPARREAAAAAASADVEQTLAAQRGASLRDQQRRGVNPSSGAAMAMQGTMDLGAAKLKAGAANAARTQVETIGHARKMDAANLGRNLASNQATSAGLALTAGNNSTSNAQVPLSVAQSGANIMNTGFSGAQQGLAGAASTYGQIANLQQKASAESGAAFGALGSVAGQFAGSSAGSALIAGAFSDVNMKEDIEPVDPDQALQAVEATPVSNWAYKAGTVADDGGQKHTGPMAQDVKRTMGEKVAPNGKKLDLISMNGVAMAAIQGLSRKVDRIAAASGLPA